MRKFLLLLLLLPFAGQAATLPAPTSTPCRDQKLGRALDFWIGDWTVTNADGSKAGENRIERLLDGCAVIEHWHGVDKGDDGLSLFTYDAVRHGWDQTWVTQDTSRPGGLKHKRLTLILHAGAARFEGTIVTPKGPLIDQTTLAPLDDGRVRQTIAWSRDNGRTWKTVFDAFYARKH
ncbi:MAG TPA: hypothetical protein VGG48_09860 [Rhizomicrobium sp.]|jgi:hypothetical protein